MLEYSCKKKINAEEIYELYPSYHRRTRLSTKILCRRKKLQRNWEIVGQKSEHDFARDFKKLYSQICNKHILPTYRTKEVACAALILPQGYVLE